MARKPSQKYEVVRVQDGAQVRAELSREQARDECAALNAESRIQVGVSRAIHGSSKPIYASMIHGEISKYEVRSTSGLVVA